MATWMTQEFDVHRTCIRYIKCKEYIMYIRMELRFLFSLSREKKYYHTREIVLARNKGTKQLSVCKQNS